MNDMANAIMDSAERRIRVGGFNSFSFREIAADVGIKSSSVHYHFPTKGHLVTAVMRRYRERAAEHFDEALASGVSPTEAFTRVFRGTLHSERRICPCIVLGASTRDIPPEAAAEVSGFYAMCLEKMQKAGLSTERASSLLSTLTGALLLANALDDKETYDRATAELRREPASVAA